MGLFSQHQWASVLSLVCSEHQCFHWSVLSLMLSLVCSESQSLWHIGPVMPRVAQTQGLALASPQSAPLFCSPAKPFPSCSLIRCQSSHTLFISNMTAASQPAVKHTLAVPHVFITAVCSASCFFPVLRMSPPHFSKISEAENYSVSSQRLFDECAVAKSGLQHCIIWALGFFPGCLTHPCLDTSAVSQNILKTTAFLSKYNAFI